MQWNHYTVPHGSENSSLKSSLVKIEPLWMPKKSHTCNKIRWHCQELYHLVKRNISFYNFIKTWIRAEVHIYYPHCECITMRAVMNRQYFHSATAEEGILFSSGSEDFPGLKVNNSAIRRLKILSQCCILLKVKQALKK